jgi:NADH-quinone oxidoreductase subunit M
MTEAFQVSNLPLLSLLIWLPILGGALTCCWATRGRRRRAGPRCVRAAALALTRAAVHRLRLQPGRHAVRRAAHVDPGLRHPYALGADGISVALIALTTLTTVLVLVGAWGSVDRRVSQYGRRSWRSKA